MLNRKMLRDIKNNLAQYITIFLMILIGIMAYTGIESYMIGMSESANNYYKDYNLQDMNIYGNLTKDDLDKIKGLKYVKDAEGKTTITFDNENKKNHKLSLNFIDTNNISKMYLVKGEKYNKDKSGIWLDSYYAKNNNIKVGDKIKMSYGDLTLNEEVKGLINVPDHVYETKDDTELFPSHKDYGYAYLSAKKLKNSNFTSIMIDAPKDKLDDVRKEIENKIDKPIIFTKIEDELSYSNYQGEIDEGKAYVGIFSGLFIFIAILSVITTMTRTIKNERVQIGTLKALGFSNFKITMHYVSYGMFISIIASILGVIFGYFLIGKNFMDMEMSYYEVPNYHAGMTNKTYLVILIVLILIMLTIILSLKKILSKPAAEILKKEAPKVKSRTLEFTSKGLFNKLSFSTRWNIRDIIRNKGRVIMGLIGITSMTALMLTAFGMLDTMNNYLDLELNVISNYKYKMNVLSDIDKNTLNNLTNKYTNSKTIGIEIKKNNKIESNNLFINNTKGKIRVLDENLKEIKHLKNNGVYITRKMASTKNYKIGDSIKWHIYGSNKYYTSKIVGLNFDPQNQNITASKEYLESLNIKYIPDTLYTNANLKNKKIKGVNNIQSIDSVRKGIGKMLNTMYSVILLIIVIALILGFVIIYNMSIISFTEKDYQFATLKVLGFSDSKISKIFIKQNIWISLLSIILGLPFGYLITDYLFKYAIADNYDFFANINITSYIYSVLITFILTILTSKFVSNKINNIDMVKSLKSNE